MTANEANLTRRVEALANVVAELTAVNADIVRRVESLEGYVVRGVPRPVVDVRDGSVRVSSPDGSPAVVHRAEFVIEETPDE